VKIIRTTGPTFIAALVLVSLWGVLLSPSAHADDFCGNPSDCTWNFYEDPAWHLTVEGTNTETGQKFYFTPYFTGGYLQVISGMVRFSACPPPYYRVDIPICEDAQHNYIGQFISTINGQKLGEASVEGAVLQYQLLLDPNILCQCDNSCSAPYSNKIFASVDVTDIPTTVNFPTGITWHIKLFAGQQTATPLLSGRVVLEPPQPVDYGPPQRTASGAIELNDPRIGALGATTVTVCVDELMGELGTDAACEEGTKGQGDLNLRISNTFASLREFFNLTPPIPPAPSPIDTTGSYACTWQEGKCVVGDTECQEGFVPDTTRCGDIKDPAVCGTTENLPCTVPLGLAEKIQNLYYWVVSLAGLVALGLIIFGGVMYAASGGNPSRISEAKSWITHALAGLGMLLAAYLILGFINPDLTKLQDIFLRVNVNPQAPGLELGEGGGEESVPPEPPTPPGPPIPPVPIDEIVSPQEWGADKDYDSWNDPWVDKDKIIIHYGGGENPAGDSPYSQTKEMAVLRGWEEYHLSKGWRGIAYNYAIGQSGTIYRLRGWSWNAGQWNAPRDDVDGDGISDNNESVAVVFILGGDQIPTAEALAAFESLRASLEQSELVGRTLPLYPHKTVALSGTEIDETSCPGAYLSNYAETH